MIKLGHKPSKLMLIFYKVLFVGYLLYALGSTYQYMQLQSELLGPLFILNNSLPRSMSEVQSSTFWKQYLSCLFPVQFSNPLYLMFQSVPSYGVKNKTLKLYDEEVKGYFQLSDANELLTLDKDNIYIPKFPVTAKDSVEMDRLGDSAYVYNKFFTGDSVLKVGEDLVGQWDFSALANQQFSVSKEKEGPKVLIFHTHVHEYFKGEKIGENGEVTLDKGIVAVGEELALLLEKQYGLETLHVTESFYATPTTTGTDKYEYDRMEPIIEAILEANPSIEIVLDLHRDAVDGTHKFVTTVDGKPTAQIMFVNGICMRRDAEGNLVQNTSLTNPNLTDNLAFAIQAQINGITYYPGLMRKIYLKPYRYSTHMRPKSLLIELGNQNNTLEEAVNAAGPIADIIAKVLEKD